MARVAGLKTLTIRLNENFHRRLRSKLSGEGTNFQAKVQTMLEDYVYGPTPQREEIARQVVIAREAMRRYAPAMRNWLVDRASLGEPGRSLQLSGR